VVIDRDLLDFDLIWAAGGTPHAVFPIAPDALVRVTNGRVLDLKVEEQAS
jgi:prolyl-tRNA editing enzyme YbaK/EbsC (Cys-tRNA(Pro) deacylase)